MMVFWLSKKIQSNFRYNRYITNMNKFTINKNSKKYVAVATTSSSGIGHTDRARNPPGGPTPPLAQLGALEIWPRARAVWLRLRATCAESWREMFLNAFKRAYLPMAMRKLCRQAILTETPWRASMCALLAQKRAMA